MDGNENFFKLFSEFPTVSTEQWEEQIKADLKGADYDKKLIWKTIEGIKVKPYYRKENLLGLEHLIALPGHNPFTRGNKTKNNHWYIREDFDSVDIVEANKNAQEAVLKGATAIGFNAKYVNSAKEMENLLQGIVLENIGIHFYSAKSYTGICELFINEIERQKINLNKVNGSFNFDSINYFLILGSFYTTLNNDFVEATSLIKQTVKKLPLFKAINVNGQYFHNAGASITQEVAFILSSANEYLTQLTSKGISIDEIADKIQFTVAVGSNYFMEIAKIRAIRYLWARIVQEYKPKNEISKSIFIHGVTSSWNKSIYDPYVNILRSTTEAMSAIIAGCDSMTIIPFDSTFKKADDFSKRIARNTQIILKGEAHFDEVIDPAAGSYYIENLTDSIASSAWEIFKTIESKGGFIEVAKENYIKEEIEKTCLQRDLEIATRKQVMVGTNQYPNLNEKMLEKMQPLDSPHSICGLMPNRAGKQFEKIRFATEDYEKKYGKRPKVFLFSFGNVGMRKARATFITNFFGCAGYQIFDNNGFKTIQDGVNAALSSKAEIIVFCSSDEEYAGFVPDACQLLKKSNEHLLTIVAGSPADLIATQKQHGIDDFISIKTNTVNTLEKYQHILGIL